MDPVIKVIIINKNFFLFIILFNLICSHGIAASSKDTRMCTYQTYKWNVNRNLAEEIETVRHAYSELKPEEVDTETGCTVCVEDQEIIDIPGLSPFRLCKNLAASVRVTLTQLLKQGEPIHEVTGYRVGKTRGAIDKNGNRTLFSIHSFGIAIDINPEENGLYADCPTLGPRCRLIRGGHWIAGKRGALTADGAVVTGLKKAGLQWGGELKGNLKDFMHFSPTGY